MFSGKQYRLVMAPAAHRYFKKFDQALQEKVKTEAMRLARDWSALRKPPPLKQITEYFHHEGHEDLEGKRRRHA